MTIPIPRVPSRPLQYLTAIRNSGLPPTTRAVCWAIASFADDTTGEAYPSLRALSKATGLAKPTVSKHTILAESKGYLHKQQRFNNSMTYVITTPVFPEEASANAADVEAEETSAKTMDDESVVSYGEAWLRSLYGIGDVS